MWNAEKITEFVGKQDEWIERTIEQDLNVVLKGDVEIIEILTKGLNARSTLITYCVFLIENSVYDNFRTEFDTKVVPNDLHFPILRKILDKRAGIEKVVDEYLSKHN